MHLANNDGSFVTYQGKSIINLTVKVSMHHGGLLEFLTGVVIEVLALTLNPC